MNHRITAGALAFVCVATPVIAATDATVSASGPYLYIEPYLVALFGVIFSTIFGWAVAVFQQKTGITISNDARAAVNSAAMNAAGRIFASQEAHFANAKIDVHSPLIAQEIPRLAAGVQSEIERLGITPDRLANLVLAKLGQLQAQASSVAPVVPTPTNEPHA